MITHTVSLVLRRFDRKHYDNLRDQAEKYPIGHPTRAKLMPPSKIHVSSILEEVYPALFSSWRPTGDPRVGKLYDAAGKPFGPNVAGFGALGALKEAIMNRRPYYRTVSRQYDGIRPRIHCGLVKYVHLPLCRDSLHTHAFVDLLSEKLSAYWRGGGLEYAWASPDWADLKMDRRYIPEDCLLPWRESTLDEAAEEFVKQFVEVAKWSRGFRHVDEESQIMRVRRGEERFHWGSGRPKGHKLRPDTVQRSMVALGKAPTPEQAAKSITERIAMLEDELRMLKDVNPSDLDPNANEQGGDEHTEVLVPKKDTKTEAPKPPAAPEKIEPMKGLFV